MCSENIHCRFLRTDFTAGALFPYRDCPTEISYTCLLEPAACHKPCLLVVCGITYSPVQLNAMPLPLCQFCLVIMRDSGAVSFLHLGVQTTQFQFVCLCFLHSFSALVKAIPRSHARNQLSTTYCRERDTDPDNFGKWRQIWMTFLNGSCSSHFSRRLLGGLSCPS